MERENLISIQQFCVHYAIDSSFIYSLQEEGLIEIITIEERGFIPLEKIHDIEKIVRMHDELEINLAGIDAIFHLLHQIAGMQDEILKLKNKLNRHEGI
jgi:hypothetical protein